MFVYLITCYLFLATCIFPLLVTVSLFSPLGKSCRKGYIFYFCSIFHSRIHLLRFQSGCHNRQVNLASSVVSIYFCVIVCFVMRVCVMVGLVIAVSLGLLYFSGSFYRSLYFFSILAKRLGLKKAFPTYFVSSKMLTQSTNHSVLTKPYHSA